MAMLGAKCSPCCSKPCDDCEEGNLPDTLTVQITGKPGDPQQGPDLLSLAFSKTCFGSGASGTVDGDGEDLGPGPLNSVTLTSGGSGYAKLGREAPSLSVSNSNTSPATLSFTLTQSQDACNLDLWAIDSIAVTDGGLGYTNNASLTIAASVGDTQVTAATGTIKTTRIEPTIKASTADGSGATFTVSVTKTAATPPTWTISGVTFSGTTSGFIDGQAVTFSGDGLVTVQPASATVVTAREQPQLSLSVFGFGGGTGANVTATLTSNANSPETWSVSNLSITSAGTNYQIGDPVIVSVDSGFENSQLVAEVDQVGGSGEIVSIDLQNGGDYYDIGDVLDSIAVSDGGEFYRDDGIIESITITDGGSYYRENATLTPYVETPTVTVQQQPPSNGTGAQVTAVVDDDTASATFGQVISLTLDNAGDDYLAWVYVYLCDCTNTTYTVVVKRAQNPIFTDSSFEQVREWTDRCRYIGFRCADTDLDEIWPDTRRDSIQVVYYAPPQKPVVIISQDVIGEDACDDLPTNGCEICSTTLTSTTEEPNCSSLEFTAQSESESVSAEVSVGGEFDSDLYLAGLCEFRIRIENFEFADPEYNDSELAAAIKLAINGDHHVYRTAGVNAFDYGISGDCEYAGIGPEFTAVLVFDKDAATFSFESGSFFGFPGFFAVLPNETNNLLSCTAVSGSYALSAPFPAASFDYTIDCP